MSRFFTAGDSSSESSSSDEEELYSDDEPTQDHDEEESSEEDEDEDEDESSSDDEGAAGGVSRFLRDAASSDGDSSDSDTPKVVKSAKNKRLEELEGVVKLIYNAVKINDWSTVSTGGFKTLGTGFGVNSICRIRQAQPSNWEGGDW